MTTEEQREPSGTQKLIAALEQQENVPPDLMKRAKSGYYDEFTGALAMPIWTLVADLHAAGLEELVMRAKQGDFEHADWESEQWAQSEEGQEVIRELAAHPIVPITFSRNWKKRGGRA